MHHTQLLLSVTDIPAFLLLEKILASVSHSQNGSIQITVWPEPTLLTWGRTDCLW